MLAADLKDDPPNTSQAELSVTPIPDGADTEVDGAFMRNAPSTLELSSGDRLAAHCRRNWRRSAAEWPARTRVLESPTSFYEVFRYSPPSPACGSRGHSGWIHSPLGGHAIGRALEAASDIAEGSSRQGMYKVLLRRQK